jgi:hypothetical protein
MAFKTKNAAVTPRFVSFLGYMPSGLSFAGRGGLSHWRQARLGEGAKIKEIELSQIGCRFHISGIIA